MSIIFGEASTQLHESGDGAIRVALALRTFDSELLAWLIGTTVVVGLISGNYPALAAGSPVRLVSTRSRNRRSDSGTLPHPKVVHRCAGLERRVTDAILCRWGLDGLPNLSSTLTSVRRMLSRDGLFVASVWAAGPDARPLAGVAAAVARETFDLSNAKGKPLPSSVGSEEMNLVALMNQAEFADIRSEKVTIELEWPFAGDCVLVSPGCFA